jgi:drug/metabolite transporter (DMT)-like permease
LVYWAVYHGVRVGVAALIGGLQPVITAILAAVMLGEALSRLQWTGIIVGFAGVALVVSTKLAVSFSLATIGLEALCLAGVASIAYGSIYQKRFERAGDTWTRTAVMFAGALLPPLAGALLLIVPHPARRGGTRQRVHLSRAAGLGSDGVSRLR